MNQTWYGTLYCFKFKIEKSINKILLSNQARWLSCLTAGFIASSSTTISMAFVFLCSSLKTGQLALLKRKYITVFSNRVRNTDNTSIVRFVENILGHIVRYCHSIKKMWILIFNLYTTTEKTRISIVFKICSTWNICNLKLNERYQL